MGMTGHGTRSLDRRPEHDREMITHTRMEVDQTHTHRHMRFMSDEVWRKTDNMEYQTESVRGVTVSKNRNSRTPKTDGTRIIMPLSIETFLPCPLWSVVLPVWWCVSGGLQVNWGCESRVGRVPRLVTNRNVVLVLEGRRGLKRWWN